MSRVTYNRRLRGLGLSLLAATTATAIFLAPSARAAGEAPGWQASSLALPTEFVAGDAVGKYAYDVRAADLGAAATDGTPLTLTDVLPKGLTVKGDPILLLHRESSPGAFELTDYGPSLCEEQAAAEVTTVTCHVPHELAEVPDPAVVEPGEEIQLKIPVLIPPSAEEGEALHNHFEVEGGGAPPASVDSGNEVATLDSEGHPLPAPAGFSYYDALATGPDGLPLERAGSHPYQFTVSYGVNTDPAGSSPSVLPRVVPAGGDVKDTGVRLPAGLIGSATAAKECTRQEFNKTEGHIAGGTLFFSRNFCPDGSVVGFVTLRYVEAESFAYAVPLYNLVPPPGQAAQFGFQYANLPFFIDTEVRSGSDYGLVSVLHNQSQVKRVSAASVTVWGTPADPRHDPVRGSCMITGGSFRLANGDECPAGIAPRYLLRLPTSCQGPLDLPLLASHWPTPSAIETVHSTPLDPVGCNELDFEADLQARPTTDVADQPTGLDAHLHIPQEEDPEALGTADLRKTVVTLPPGLVINPSSANGLDACAPSGIGLLSGAGVSPPQFTPDPSDCPAAARIGTAEVTTPLLGHPLRGGVYVAMPHANPFGSLLAIYIAVNDEATGINLKLAGEVSAAPATGRLTTTFSETPQQPFSDFELHFFGGPLAALRTPQTCGAYSTDSVMTPWSAPESGPPASDSDHYSISKAPGGGSCPTSQGALPQSPGFDAGTIAPVARAYTPFALNLSRADGTQEFGSLSVTTPPGLLGKLADIPYCPEAALAQAAVKSGNQEKAAPSCPAASRVGEVDVAAGAGPSPYNTQGTAYLTGPYKGAPLSLAIVTPATAGPYDLGTVVVRTALRVDPETARITAVSDPIPHILQGIPLDVRRIAVKLDRPEFTFNPSNCNPFAIEGSLLSALGGSASLSSRFQVGECARLPFKPKLSLKLKGGTKRAQNPALIATVKAGPEEAGFARAQVKLPRSAFLDQSHIRTICTRVQFAADACPQGSIYGKATATTPLLDYPVSGNVYLRSSDHKLPDLVVDLRGPASQPLRFDLVGRTDSVGGALRNTFEGLPDAPVKSFRLELFGGRRGLVVNSRNLCAYDYRAEVKLDGQNGRIYDSRPVVGNGCKKHRRGAKGRGERRR